MTSFCCSLLMLGSSFFFRKATVLLRFLSLSLFLLVSLSLSLFLSVCPVLLLLLPYHAVLPGQETLDDAAVGLLAELAERLGRGHGTLFFFSTAMRSGVVGFPGSRGRDSSVFRCGSRFRLCMYIYVLST